MRKLKVGRTYKVTGVNPASEWNLSNFDSTITIISNNITSQNFGKYEASCEFYFTRDPEKTTYFCKAFSARIIREREVCTCGTYKFPHRKGSGKCIADQGPFCGECGEPCTWRRARIGVGCNYRPVSSCCSGDVYMDVQLKKLADFDCDGDLEEVPYL